MSDNQTIPKLDMASPDLVSQNIAHIATLFPNCIVETSGGTAIDFDLLKQELSSDIIEGPKERYRLEWPGKKEAIVTANLPTTKTLRPDRDKSINFNETQNLYIEGDNLEILKLLQESYLEKIKMIFIDPPYNTGKDFIYNDDYKQNSEDFRENSGQLDEYNQRLIANPETSGRYHSDWLSMMYSRLKLSRNLLCTNGVIFIAIDDNEVDNLKKICNEIFGEINFRGCVIWQHSLQPKGYGGRFSNHHNYILVYAKSEEYLLNSLERTEEHNVNYKNPDNDPKGKWRSGDVRNALYRPNLIYDLKTPSGKIISPPENGWRWSKETMQKKINEKEIIFNDYESKIIRKIYLSELEGRTPETIWFGKEVGTTRDAASELKVLFNDKTPFDTPKPTALIKRMLELSNLEEGDIILDFFSGSSTTAHAVMSYNAENNINLSYINIQLPENVDPNNPSGKIALEENLATISDIGRERIKRAAKKLKNDTNANIDYGFRMYRLDESNMQDVYYKPQDYIQDNLELFADNVKSGRTGDDLLTQIMLDWGLPLSLGIEQLKIAGKNVFKVAVNSLMACFETGVEENFAKEIANYKPLRLVFRDSSFKNDTAKENVRQLLKQLSPDTEMRVI